MNKCKFCKRENESWLFCSERCRDMYFIEVVEIEWEKIGIDV